MKKKVISVAVGLIALVTLASCSSSSDGDLTIVRSDLALDLAEVKDKYKLNFIYDLANEAKRLDSSVDINDDSDYYTVYVSNDVENSAFVYSVDISEDLKSLEKRVQNYTVNSLTFKTSNGIYDSEVTSIASKIYDSTTGLNQFKFAASDADNLNVYTGTSLAYAESAKGAVAAYKNGNTSISLDIVYVPTFVVRNYGEKNMQKQKILEKVIFAPIYAQYTTNGQKINTDGTLVASRISFYNKIDIVFDDIHVSTEKPAE